MIQLSIYPPIHYRVAVIRNIIFDWSGTLVDDLPAVWQATNYVLTQAGLSELALDEFRAQFCLPFTNFYSRHLQHIGVEQLEAWFHSRFKQVQDSVVELPHARDFLKFCQTEGLRCFLLSSVHPDHFAVQTAVNGFDQFLEHAYTGVWNKQEKIHQIIAENRLVPEETLFIGDMQHDIETAKHGGTYSCAVLTGYNTVGQLRAAKPDLIVEHLHELKELLRWNGKRIAAHANDSRLPVATVGALIFNDQGEMLMIRTHKWSNLWGIPGGKIKFGESSLDALRREIKEETNLSIKNIRFAIVQDCIHSKEFYRDEHFVLLNYTCEAETPIDVRLNEEGIEYQWHPPAAALKLELNVPTRRLIEAVVEYRSHGQHHHL